ncbi:MAG: dTMP kinase [Nitriliruptorales bacterium]|nr:dTMP kinase [Nitriliruptorales bacterium]
MAAEGQSRPHAEGMIPGVTERGVRGLVEGAAGYRPLLRNRNYRLFFLASLGSSLGDWAGLFALQILILQLSTQGSRFALFSLGAIMMARLLPSLLLGPVAGVFADRYDRKRLMVFCNVVRGVLFLGIALSTDLIALLALTFIVECLALMFVAAKDSSVPSVVGRRQLTEANQLNLLATYGPLPFGAALPALIAGITALLANAGLDVNAVRLVLVLNALALFAAGGLISRLRLPARRRAADHDEPANFLAELRSGMTFIGGRPLIRSLILGVVGVFFGAGVVVTLGPEFVRTELGRPSTDWSLLITTVGVGLAVGIAVVGLTRTLSKAKVFPWALAATGAITAIIATLPDFPLTLAFGFLLGVAAGIAFVMGYTLLHETTPDDVRGKTFAAFYTATRAALFSSLAVAPFVAAFIGFFSLRIGDFRVSMSGVRASMLVAGLVGLFAAVRAGRGMYRAVNNEQRSFHLPGQQVGTTGEGVFVAFEGVEGSGKSTQVHALVEILQREGHEVVITREPGGPPVAEHIRDLLLDPDIGPMHPRTEALLYAAARAEHLEQVVLPALHEGKVVICDRFLDSSLAYQGYGRGLGTDDVLDINTWAVDGVLPHVVVLLRLDPAEGLRRVAERIRDAVNDQRDTTPPGGRTGMDRLEQADLAFHRRVAEGYLQLVRRDPGRFLVVDASADAMTVARSVRTGLHRWLPLPAVQDPAKRLPGGGAAGETGRTARQRDEEGKESAADGTARAGGRSRR